MIDYYSEPHDDTRLRRPPKQHFYINLHLYNFWSLKRVSIYLDNYIVPFSILRNHRMSLPPIPIDNYFNYIFENFTLNTSSKQLYINYVCSEGICTNSDRIYMIMQVEVCKTTA